MFDRRIRIQEVIRNTLSTFVHVSRARVTPMILPPLLLPTWSQSLTAVTFTLGASASGYRPLSRTRDLLFLLAASPYIQLGKFLFKNPLCCTFVKVFTFLRIVFKAFSRVLQRSVKSIGKIVSNWSFRIAKFSGTDHDSSMQICTI